MSLFKLHNVEKVASNIVRAGVLGVKAANKGVEIFGLHIINKSSQKVPFDEGTLQKSLINEPVKDGVKIIGYDQPYAAKQHEDTTLIHPGRNSKNPTRGAKGEAKYLENPMKQEAPKLAGFVAAQVDKVL